MNRAILNAVTITGKFEVKQFILAFKDDETLPDKIERLASELELTPEELIKRFIAEGIGNSEAKTPCSPGTSLTDFLTKNGVLKR